MLPSKHRKIILAILFLAILFFQGSLYYFWRKQIENKEKIAQTIEEINKPNLAMLYGNKAISYFFSADNYFAKYLQSYDPKMLDNYKISLKNLSTTLDTLDQLTHNDKEFSQIINTKENKSVEVAGIKKRLDSLINNGFANIGLYSPKPYNASDLSLEKYDTEKSLNSITYDTIREKQESEKKGLFGRLGNAISGESDVNKEKVEIRITMKVGKEKISGSFADQLKHITNDINTYYAKSFVNTNKNFQKQLQNTYNTLQNKDKEIVTLNESILRNSKEVIDYYSSAAMELNMQKQRKFLTQYSNDFSNQNSIIRYLLISTGLATLLLLLYTIAAYLYEKKIFAAKKIAEENDQMKTRILGMLSHEMRAPLTIISSQSSALQSQMSSSQGKDLLNTILFNSNSLNLTVNQILELLRNENKELKTHNVNLNLKEEINNIIHSLNTLAQSKNVNIISQLDDSINQLVWVDRVKIHQLFYNLIGNAIKFTQNGTITVQSLLEKNSADFQFITKIIDTGKGIPKDEVSQVFNKYYQSNQSEYKKLGLGLGLNLCKEIVELYQGTITMESEVNKGSIVTFVMRLGFPHLVDNESITSEKALQFAQKPKVAIVDDDEFLRKYIVKMLQNQNAETFAFDNAQALINYLTENHTIDILLTDIQLPEISGFELAKIIRQMSNQSAKIPIIAVSGDYTLQEKDLKNHQINDYILKPVKPEKLFEIIQKNLIKNE